jgi:ATP synthase (C/AC39) subunit
MSAGWVAGSVRAKAMARRRLGRATTRELAASSTTDQALHMLTQTAYGHDVRPGLTVARAQHAVRAVLLWHLRVLAGWQPRAGAELVRRLAAWYEIANVEEQFRRFAGEPAEPAYELGALVTSWRSLAACGGPAELREALARSPWGDPGGDGPYAVSVTMRFIWAERLTALPAAPVPWAAGAAALLLAREQLRGGRTLPAPAHKAAAALLGHRALEATSMRDLATAADPDAAWVFDGIDQPTDLWRAEAAWWRRVEDDGLALLRSVGHSPGPLLGAIAVLAADAWRVCAALELSDRGGALLEVFDAVA